MTLSEAIKKEIPEITDTDFMNGKIILRNDGKGDYIKEWDYEKQIPAKMKLLKIWKNTDDTVQ